MSNSFLIFASILFSAFLGLSFIQVTKFFNPEGHHGGDHHAKNGLALPAPAAGATSGPVFEMPVSVLLANANTAQGPKQAAKCTTCHSFEAGGANKLGPALWNIVGADIAANADFAYSGALEGIDGAWTAEALNGFLLKPKAWAPGTKMGFAGIKDDEDRANLIAWLYEQADSPVALPAPTAEELAAVAEFEAAQAAN